MTNGLSDNLIARIRQSVKRKKTEHHVKYTPEFIERIREMTHKLDNKAEVARRLGIPYAKVLEYTQDIKTRNYMFGKKTLALLQDIVNHGYALLGNGDNSRLRRLQRHFPAINLARTGYQSIAFLPKHEDEAMRAMLKNIDKKVWSYHELRAITKLFDTDLPREEKHRLAGINEQKEEKTEQHTLDEFQIFMN